MYPLSHLISCIPSWGCFNCMTQNIRNQKPKVIWLASINNAEIGNSSQRHKWHQPASRWDKAWKTAGSLWLLPGLASHCPMFTFVQASRCAAAWQWSPWKTSICSETLHPEWTAQTTQCSTVKTLVASATAELHMIRYFSEEYVRPALKIVPACSLLEWINCCLKAELSSGIAVLKSDGGNSQTEAIVNLNSSFRKYNLEEIASPNLNINFTEHEQLLQYCLNKDLI